MYSRLRCVLHLSVALISFCEEQWIIKCLFVCKKKDQAPTYSLLGEGHMSTWGRRALPWAGCGGALAARLLQAPCMGTGLPRLGRP